MKKILLCVAMCIAQTALVMGGDAIVAKVNGSAITHAELEIAIDKLIPRASYHGAITEEKRNEFREAALEDLILQELQYQDALAKGMKPGGKEVDARMKNIRARYSSRSEFRSALEQVGMTEDALSARIQKEVLVSQMTNSVITLPSRVTDKELEEYYSKNTSKYEEPETVRLRIISAKEKMKIMDALKRILAGEDFGKVAAMMSEDNYRIRGGDVGYVHRGRLLPELEHEGFSIKNPDDIRGPISASGKWFAIKFEGKRPARTVSFDEIREKLRKELETSRAETIRDAWIAQLRSKSVIEIVDNKPPVEITK